jgi:hypothetical protein
MYRRRRGTVGALAALTMALVAVFGTGSAQASFLGGGFDSGPITTQGGIALAYHANMDASQMVASGFPGETGASGLAELSLDSSSGQICFNISWSGITDNVVFGHIHQGAYGQPEDPSVTVNLFGPDTNGATSPQSGCVLAPGEITAIEAAPSDFIVILHTSNFAAGAIRGQIQPGS